MTNYSNLCSDDLDLYMIRNIIRKGTRRYGGVDFYDLLSTVRELYSGINVTSDLLRESLEFMHDYGFGIIFNGATAYYDYEYDYAA